MLERPRTMSEDGNGSRSQGYAGTLVRIIVMSLS